MTLLLVGQPLVELRISQLEHYLKLVVLVECVDDMLEKFVDTVEIVELVMIAEKLDIVELVGKHVVDMTVTSVVDRLVVVADNG